MNQSDVLRVAIIGGGPSGFYMLEALKKQNIAFKADIYEKYFYPFGLLRGGVAPDHPNIKKLEVVFDRLAQSTEGFRFLGNVCVGKDISIQQLRGHYHAVVYCTGAMNNKRLNIPGEDLKGVYSATNFVGWYNSVPDFTHLKFDLLKDSSVAVIGQGNVALDVTRILAEEADALQVTDIAPYALDKLKQTMPKEIHLIGRRGPVQAAFTSPELKELRALKSWDIHIQAEDLNISDVDRMEIQQDSKAQKNFQQLQEILATPTKNLGHTLYLHFYKGPIELLSDENQRVKAIKLKMNRLEGQAFQQKAVPTNHETILNCQTVFQSIGYMGNPIEGVPFDSKLGTIPNAEGRVLDQGNILPGEYACGWIARGATGTLGTNKKNATDVVDKIMQDLQKLLPKKIQDTDSLVEQLIQSKPVVTYKKWLEINQEELEAGKKIGKVRLKKLN